MELFHPFAQVFDDYACKAKSLGSKADSLNQQRAQVYGNLNNLIRLFQDVIYDMFDEIIKYNKEYLLKKSSVQETSEQVRQITRYFVEQAEAHPGDYEIFEEKVYSAFKWAFEKYKKVGGRATKNQWKYN